LRSIFFAKNFAREGAGEKAYFLTVSDGLAIMDGPKEEWSYARCQLNYVPLLSWLQVREHG
jgi:hypothetical protein